MGCKASQSSCCARRGCELVEGGEAMSMLSTQVDNLRLTADYVSEHGATSGDLAIIEIRLREAADTIEKLEHHSNQLEPSRYSKLFGTPERAARTLESIPCGNSPCSECPIFEPCLKWRTKSNALLEWLRGDAE